MLFISSATGARAAAQTGVNPAPRLVGTWQLRGEEVRRADTGGFEPNQSSDKSIGVLVYDDAGHMAAQIDRRAWDPQSPYVAYFGTYTVDAAAGVVVHHVESSTNDYKGTDQKRGFELLDGGRTLVLISHRPGVVPTVARLRWQRVN